MVPLSVLGMHESPFMYVHMLRIYVHSTDVVQGYLKSCVNPYCDVPLECENKPCHTHLL